MRGNTAMNYNQYISTDPKIAFGKSCIAGTRISVEFILERFSLGATIDYMLEQYPDLLTREKILAAFNFARECVHDSYIQDYIAS